jgi:hypothetical protein
LPLIAHLLDAIVDARHAVSRAWSIDYWDRRFGILFSARKTFEPHFFQSSDALRLRFFSRGEFDGKKSAGGKKIRARKKVRARRKILVEFSARKILVAAKLVAP